MDENKFNIVMAIIIFIGILLVIGSLIYTSYIHSQLRYENFQATIKDLSNEEKCLHICGFQWPGTTSYDGYKFCIEKCDRISERQTGCNNG